MIAAVRLFLVDFFYKVIVILSAPEVALQVTPLIKLIACSDYKSEYKY